MLVHGSGSVPAGAGLGGGEAVGRWLGRWGVLEASAGAGWVQPLGPLSAPYRPLPGLVGEAALAARLGRWVVAGAATYRTGQWAGGAGVQYQPVPWLTVGAEGLWPGVAGGNLRVLLGRGWSVVLSGGLGVVAQPGTPKHQAALALAYHAQPPPPPPKPAPPPPAPPVASSEPPQVVSADDQYEPTGESAEPDEGLPYLRVTVTITGRKAEESKGRAEQVCKALEAQSGLPVDCVLGAVTVTPDKTRIELSVERLTTQ